MHQQSPTIQWPNHEESGNWAIASAGRKLGAEPALGEGKKFLGASRNPSPEASSKGLAEGLYTTRAQCWQHRTASILKENCDVPASVSRVENYPTAPHGTVSTQTLGTVPIVPCAAGRSPPLAPRTPAPSDRLPEPLTLRAPPQAGRTDADPSRFAGMRHS